MGLKTIGKRGTFLEKTKALAEKRWFLQKLSNTGQLMRKIPSFRVHHVDENVKLNEFVKRLTEGKASAKHTFPECGLGAIAIREMVMGHMRERRQKMKDTAVIFKG